MGSFHPNRKELLRPGDDGDLAIKKPVLVVPFRQRLPTPRSPDFATAPASRIPFFLLSSLAFIKFRLQEGSCLKR